MKQFSLTMSMSSRASARTRVDLGRLPGAGSRHWQGGSHPEGGLSWRGLPPMAKPIGAACVAIRTQRFGSMSLNASKEI